MPGVGDPYLLKKKFLQISIISSAYALELQRICAGASAYALEPTHMRWSQRICAAALAHMRCICARTAAHMRWGQKANEASGSLRGENVFSNHTQCIWYFFTFSRMRCRPLRRYDYVILQTAQKVPETCGMDAVKSYFIFKFYFK